ncbi:rhomboid family intramembrane serine protease [Croceimicrobium sp.]|uniref:rhomboid family intramembrane serine protease n=1 Tax=Croceimicrobium sp. TaxID=2828340 RepID=UPI003BAA1CDD
MQRFNLLPMVIKNLIIINGLFFLGMIVLGSSFGINLGYYLGLHLPISEAFQPHQLITHIFMHANFTHLLFNMFALWMFGFELENIWKPKRFLNYYLLTGLGAAALHLGTLYWEFNSIAAELSAEQLSIIKSQGAQAILEGKNFVDPLMAHANGLLNGSTVGASGAVFGILLAFGMMFPNRPIFLMFFPIPIKAKYLVAGYGLLELYSGFQMNTHSNVAHFAHLGGMLFGFLILRYWKKKHGTYY